MDGQVDAFGTLLTCKQAFKISSINSVYLTHTHFRICIYCSVQNDTYAEKTNPITSNQKGTNEIHVGQHHLSCHRMHFLQLPAPHKQTGLINSPSPYRTSSWKNTVSLIHMHPPNLISNSLLLLNNYTTRNSKY